MRLVVGLEDYGVHVWHGHLENHDFLWFATSDLNATASTWPILHNYALTYAICQYSHAAYVGCRPQYDLDLNTMKAYAVPTQNPHAGKTRLTHNALDELTQGTSAVVGSSGKATPARFNTPKLGHRICLTPAMQRGAGKASQRNVGFDLYLFTWDAYRPPSVFRLGKKGCPVRVGWREVETPTAVIPDNDFVPTHPVNPRDLLRPPSESVVYYYPAIIPPHLLYAEATLRGEWAVHVPQAGWVHVPSRVVRRWQPTTVLKTETQ